jgi:predicted nucleotidyltransferase
MYIAGEDHQAIVAWAESTHDIAEVWLFGSYARGDHTADSDTDLAVILLGADVSQRQVRWMEASWRTGPKLSRPVQLDYYDPEIADWFGILTPALQSDGILLYRRATIGLA